MGISWPDVIRLFEILNQDDNENQIKFYEFEKYFSGNSQVEEIDHKCSIF
jgi:hypothetical protein